MNKKVKTVIWILAGIIVASILVFPKLKSLNNRDRSRQNQAGQTSTMVRTVVANPGRLREIIKASGSLLADEEVDLAFETSGKITAIYFTEGAHVKKGQLLAKLNDDELKAESGKLEIQKKLAMEKAERQKVLLDKEAVSQESYDQLKTDLQGIEAEIEILLARIAETEIHAPFDGIIGLRYVSEGAFVTSSTFIARLVKIRPLKIDFSIPERYAGMVKPGTNLTFRLEDAVTTYHARVYAVEPGIDTKTRTIALRAVYDNRNEELQPGRFVSIELVIREKEDALQVPTECIIPELGGEKVFIVRNGRAWSSQVKTGLRTEGTIEILEGISPGDTVVVSGIMQLRNDMQVVIEPEQKTNQD
ncbi:MAG: efflux RND transporter periplasmic adaptor subunit [Bacteroidales bacterium]|nr:efflux RND transporter periplasmic adaptor subunit [Bacteroidales bacterium]